MYYYESCVEHLSECGCWILWQVFLCCAIISLAMDPIFTVAAERRIAPLILDDFEAREPSGWSVQARSGIERVAGIEAHVGKGALKWTFFADGKTRYGNLITRILPKQDLSKYDQIVLWFLSSHPLQGRVGFQLITPTGIVGLSDLNLQAKQGEWREVRLDLAQYRLEEVIGFRLFCDGLAWKPGRHVFFLDDVRAERFPEVKPPGERDYGEPLGPAFSALPQEQQTLIQRAVMPPPLAERRAPYSTPMYYLLHKGYGYRGNLDHKNRFYSKRSPKGEIGPDYGKWRLDRNRPDWQETMIRDWAELGLTSTHLNVYPSGKEMRLDPDVRQALIDFRRLSAKYGLGIGIRMDLPSGGAGPGWRVHPKNPENELESYLNWARDVAAIFKGGARYYVIGDEYDFHRKKPEEGGWTADLYLQVWTQVAKAIRSVDPGVTLSMFGASSGRWNDAIDVLSHDEYRKMAGAVAINYPTFQGVEKFFADIKRIAPGMQLLSNGVGYCSSKDAQPRYPEHDPYSRYTDRDQGCTVAKNMFVWWELGAGAAPYYITLRSWVFPEKTYPRWFGFFGIEDYVIDAQKNLTVKRYPAWYAFQTIAQTFHDRPSFTKPRFAVTPAKEVSRFSAFVRGEKELVMILWQDFRKTLFTDVQIESPRFKYAVRVDLFDHTDWQDVPYTVAADGKVTLRDVRVGFDPAIVRLFAD